MVFKPLAKTILALLWPHSVLPHICTNSGPQGLSLPDDDDPYSRKQSSDTIFRDYFRSWSKLYDLAKAATAVTITTTMTNCDRREKTCYGQAVIPNRKRHSQRRLTMAHHQEDDHDYFPFETQSRWLTWSNGCADVDWLRQRTNLVTQISWTVLVGKVSTFHLSLYHRGWSP